MATTARVSVWAARGNGTIDLRRLAGPLTGEFVPPPHLAPHTSRPVYLLGDPDDRLSVYELVLCNGTADDVTRWVDLDELCRCLDDLNLPPHVVGPWRGALRDAGLLAAEPIDPTGPAGSTVPQPAGVAAA